jgi:hypothetical protein
LLKVVILVPFFACFHVSRLFDSKKKLFLCRLSQQGSAKEE